MPEYNTLAKGNTAHHRSVVTTSRQFCRKAIERFFSGFLFYALRPGRVAASGLFPLNSERRRCNAVRLPERINAFKTDPRKGTPRLVATARDDTHKGGKMTYLQELLMAKFYCVDGIGYVQAETANGLFGKQGRAAMRSCRHFGHFNKSVRGALTLDRFCERTRCDSKCADVEPEAYYLKHRGFGVRLGQEELRMARDYLVLGRTYEEAEQSVGLSRKGFAAMAAVAKLGAFRGKDERGSMSEDRFSARCRELDIDPGSSSA